MIVKLWCDKFKVAALLTLFSWSCLAYGNSPTNLVTPAANITELHATDNQQPAQKLPISKMAETAIDILENAKEAVLNSDYEIAFLSQEMQQAPFTFKYQNFLTESGRNALLLSLEGTAKEVILHDNIISYFQPDSLSFSIPGSRIQEAFPDVIYNDFRALAKYYDFVFLGKARTAGRSNQLIRIIPKDHDRYQYILWIDEKKSIPLRIDLLDSDGSLIEQIKVVELDFDVDKKRLNRYVDDRDYPIVYSEGISQQPVEHNWQLGWIPAGFKEIATNNLSFNQANINTRLFSDGIFTFSVNVSAALNRNARVNQIIQQGSTTIYSTQIADYDITIIGMLPITTIEKIAQNIE